MRTASLTEEQPWVPVQAVDCDVHPAIAPNVELRSYLPKPWTQRHIPDLVFALRPFLGQISAPNVPGRQDAFPKAGGWPGSDPQLMDDQLLRDAGVDIAILTPDGGTVNLLSGWNLDYEAAICAAVNEWLHQTWLGPWNWHGRYRGSLLLPSDPTHAVEEIEKWAGHPYFVQVVPAGQPWFPWQEIGLRQRPLSAYQAAAKHGFVFAVHGGAMGPRLNLGRHSFYIEQHADFASSGWNNLEHFIVDGVFESVPDLKVVLVECGFAWSGPFMWRMDRHWETLGAECPWIRRRPSEYVREHVRFTSQPCEEPDDPGQFEMLYEIIGGDELLMFSTDYPHWDYDDPKYSQSKIPVKDRAGFMFKNALSFYGNLPDQVRALPPANRLDPLNMEFAPPGPYSAELLQKAGD